MTQHLVDQIIKYSFPNKIYSLNILDDQYLDINVSFTNQSLLYDFLLRIFQELDSEKKILQLIIVPGFYETNLQNLIVTIHEKIKDPSNIIIFLMTKPGQTIYNSTNEINIGIKECILNPN